MITEFAYLRDLATTIRANLPIRNTHLKFDSTEDVHSSILGALLDPAIPNEGALRNLTVEQGYQSASYLAERSQLKEKLLNMLIMLKLTKSNSSLYRIALFENARALFITRSLSLFGIGGFAVKAARKGLHESKKFEFTSNTIQFLRLLSNQASQSGQIHEVVKLHRETSHYVELFAAEIKAEQLWDELVADVIITGSGSPQLAKQAYSARRALKALYATYPTFTIGFLYFRVSILSFQLEFRYAEAIGLCSEAKVFLDSHPHFDSPSFYAEFALQQLGCALQLKEYKIASQAAEVCSRKWKSGNLNWFVFMESLFLLRMHEGDYEAANDVYIEATGHSRFNIVIEHRHQRWELYGCYLEYAQGKFKDASLATKRLNVLRRMPMLTTKYGKDKAGFNLAILVLEFLILLDRKKYGALAEKIESFGKYRQRYLQPDPEGEAFVAFLMAIARDSENKSAIEHAMLNWKKAALEGDRGRKKKISLEAESLVVLPYEKLAANTLTSFHLEGILLPALAKRGLRNPSKKTSKLVKRGKQWARV